MAFAPHHGSSLHHKATREAHAFHHPPVVGAGMYNAPLRGTATKPARVKTALKPVTPPHIHVHPTMSPMGRGPANYTPYHNRPLRG